MKTRVKKIIEIVKFIHDDYYDDMSWWGADIREDGTHDPNWKKPNFIMYFIKEFVRILKIENCKHPNMKNECHFGPDSGTEYMSCPDCGMEWSHTHY